MKKTHKKIIIFTAIVFVFFLQAGNALALEVSYPTIFGLSLNDTSSFPDYARYLFNLGMAFAGIAAVIAVAWGGVLLLLGVTLGKVIDKIKGTRAPAEAKEWIKAGVLGLLILASSYLIAGTINPDLVVFKLGDLIPAFPQNPFSPTSYPSMDYITYRTIPIGSLTEKLLASTMSCYEYDPDGNPIDYATVLPDVNPITDDDGQTYSSPQYFIPTFISHDRADCLAQLSDGIQKRAQAVAEVSDAIIKLMKTCDCQGKCDDTCGGQEGCNEPLACPAPNGHTQGLCTGACVPDGSPYKGACKEPPGQEDCCPQGTKDKIEHGDVDIGEGTSTNGCDVPAATYYGLDEYRCPNKISGDEEASSYCDGGAIEGYVEKQITVNKKTVILLDQKKWHKLNLLQQMMYYQTKVNEIKGKIRDDANELNQARGELGKCYLSVPYIDLMHAVKTTDQQSKLIFTQNTYIDHDTQQPIVVAKYCTGFNYNNSSCLKKCDDMCPDSSNDAVALYQKCKLCTGDDIACLTTQQACIKDAYNQRPCPYNKKNPSQKFQECISTCQNNCANDCAEKFLACSNEYKICTDQCQNNSKCVLDNTDKCLFGSQGFVYCSNKNTDQGNMQYCLNRSYLCKNGSDQYAGYPDCVENNKNPSQNNNAGPCGNGQPMQTCANGTQSCACPAAYNNSKYNFITASISNAVAGNIFLLAASPRCTPGSSCTCSGGGNSYCSGDGTCNCNNNNGGITPTSGGCNQNYSASYLYDHPECQKCFSPYNSPLQGTSCYNKPTNSNAAPDNTSCQELCPETSKCPRASNCFECKCDEVNATLTFSAPNQSNGGVNSPGDNAGEEGYSPDPQAILAHQIVGAECNGYNYNDDPLTFYCQNQWWTDTAREGQNIIPVGGDRNCPADKAIPVGQAVDGSEKWATKIMDMATKEVNDIQNMLTLMKKIGKAETTSPIENYCKCNAQFLNSKPICTTNCQFNQHNGPVGNDPDGNPIMGPICSCTFTACKGSPCQQIIIYLSQIWDVYKTLYADFESFYTMMVQDPRSDIMKMLTYSRQSMSSCSVDQNNFGNQARLLDCTRGEDETIPSIVAGSTIYKNNTVPGYCYGQALGKLYNDSLTDDWFCCDLQKINTNPAK